jgi:DUF971 family protein/molybdopterin converting factor small subunit
MTDSHPTPTDIKLHQKSRILEISFDDGARFELPCEYLRVLSTSAEVQAAKERGEVISGKEDVNITKIEPVGTYAVNLVFDDGHDTGIFSWNTLYELGRDYDKNWQDYLKKRSSAGFGVYTVPTTPASDSQATGADTKTISLLYFVSLVTRLGRESETCEIPASVNTVGDLLGWLRQRGKTWESLLQDNKVNVTVNKQFAKPATPVANNDQIAIVPVDPL